MAGGELMGEVVVKIRLTNTEDMFAFKDGRIEAQHVRTTELNALIDTGAIRLM